MNANAAGSCDLVLSHSLAFMRFLERKRKRGTRLTARTSERRPPSMPLALREGSKLSSSLFARERDRTMANSRGPAEVGITSSACPQLVGREGTRLPHPRKCEREASKNSIFPLSLPLSLSLFASLSRSSASSHAAIVYTRNVTRRVDTESLVEIGPHLSFVTGGHEVMAHFPFLLSIPPTREVESDKTNLDMQQCVSRIRIRFLPIQTRDPSAPPRKPRAIYSTAATTYCSTHRLSVLLLVSNRSHRHRRTSIRFSFARYCRWSLFVKITHEP